MLQQELQPQDSLQQESLQPQGSGFGEQDGQQVPSIRGRVMKRPPLDLLKRVVHFDIWITSNSYLLYYSLCGMGGGGSNVES
ncbi:MAG: hypothetical protein ACLTXL_08450 [Clostridia bacterium]